MLKNLAGGAVINYGPVLPVSSTALVGSVFYLTEADAGNEPGLYIFGVDPQLVDQAWKLMAEAIVVAPPPPTSGGNGNGNYDLLLVNYGII